MELSTLISPDEATERLAHYEKQVREERTAEDEAILAGYRAAKRGQPVVSLPAAIEAGGRFEGGLPRLAIARADATAVLIERSFGDLVYSDDIPSATSDTWWRRPNTGRRSALVGAHHVRIRDGAQGHQRGQTIVPVIPPNIRPTRRRLHLFHVLWEVEKWDPTPPLDPALLRHIRGDLWAVVATWDLTELERAVLAQRR